MYEPEENPLKGLHSVRDAREIESILWDYMCMWQDHEYFRDVNIIIREGDDGMLASHLVGAGAIDADNCVPTCRDIERRIIKLADEFDSLTKKQKDQRFDDVFKGSTMYICDHCNHHSFVNADDCMSAEEMKDCMMCSKPTKAVKWGEKY